MITLIQTDKTFRFDIALETKFDDALVVEGYVEKVDGVWNAYRDGVSMGQHSNPAEAGKLVIENYPERARVILTEAVTRMKTNLAGSSDGIRRSKERMIASLERKIETSDF